MFRSNTAHAEWFGCSLAVPMRGGSHTRIAVRAGTYMYSVCVYIYIIYIYIYVYTIHMFVMLPISQPWHSTCTQSNCPWKRCPWQNLPTASFLGSRQRTMNLAAKNIANLRRYHVYFIYVYVYRYMYTSHIRQKTKASNCTIIQD